MFDRLKIQSVQLVCKTMFNIAQIKKQAARMEQQMKEIQAQLAVRSRR